MNDVSEIFDMPQCPYAVVVVILRGSRVLLCQGKPKQRTWCLPGGKVEPEDLTPVHTAFREFFEECGKVDGGLVLAESSELEPFFRGEAHDGKPLWAYVGRISPKIPDSWDAPEGRCEFVELAAAPQLYRPDWLQTFCRVMPCHPAGFVDPLVRLAAWRYLWHLENCAPCRANPPHACTVGSEAYRRAVEG